MKKIAGALLYTFTVGFFSLPFAQGEYDIDKEIGSLRKELTDIASQRKAVKENMRKDEKEYKEYIARTKQRFDALHREIDSVQSAIKAQSSVNDSLLGTINALQTAKRQVDLQQSGFRDKCVAICDGYLKMVKTFPPMVRKSYDASLSFLRSELISKTIENSEGVQRLSQILKDIDESASSIQMVQGVSPIPEIRGTAYCMRLGMLFEAVVNMEGTSYALWKGYTTDGKEVWQAGNDPAIADQLLKWVNIREGKALPEFVQLPLIGEMTMEAGK
ncbi:MAG TPA: DUF3450 family protein [Chitinispirillaceae bacterium]|nr:DUF3450 family protein [Chitinispirillaceae bacterium]